MKQLRIILIMSLVFSLSACSNGKEEGLDVGKLLSTKKELTIVPREDTITPLVKVGDERFSIDIPEGWVITTTGDYKNFGFRAYDPNEPSRSIFYYGSMSPWMKSEDAKAFWAWYAASGYPNAKVYADAPVLYNVSVEGLYSMFDTFVNYAQAYGIVHDFPSFRGAEVLEQFPISTAMADNAIDESTLRLSLSDEGFPIEALVTATLVDALSYPANGIDAGYYTAYRVCGIMAPADDFLYHQNRLSASLASFTYSESYIEEGVRQTQWQTEEALKLQNTLNETAQIINEAWSYRSLVHDKANAKFISYLRGKSYLQDPNTGQTYEGDQATVDDYLKDPKQYKNPGLVPITEDHPDFGKPVSGIIR